MEEEIVEETSLRGVIGNPCSESEKLKESSLRGVIENPTRSWSESEKVEESSPGGVIDNSMRSRSQSGILEETSPEEVIGNLARSCSESEIVEETSPEGVIENSIRNRSESAIVEETSPGGVIGNSARNRSESAIVEETSPEEVIVNSAMSCSESEKVEETSPGVIVNSAMSCSESEIVEETSPGGVIDNSIRSCSESEKVEETPLGGVIENSARSCSESEIVEETSPGGVIKNSIRSCSESGKVEETPRGGVIEDSIRSCSESEIVEETSPSGVIGNSARSCSESENVEETSQGGVIRSCSECEIVEETSPRGVIENSIRSCSESETDSSSKASPITSDSDTQSNPRRSSSHWRGMFLSILKSRSIRRLASLPPLRGVSKVTKCNRRSFSGNNDEFSSFKSSWRNFTLSELQAATKNFSSDMLLGKGGYAEVYKGCFQDGQFVAIKKLTRGTQEERTSDFLSEIGIIVHVNHPNTAKLIGYGVEGGLHLVLELSPHGSLASLLHGSNNVLEWGIRYKVALGTAEGLLYLHETCQRRIIHRDITTANILLTENFEPRITDFGLSKWLPDQWSHHTVSKLEGTFGYLAPEYVMHGIVDEKTDVFAFGVLLLELITGKRALDKEEKSLVMWANPLLDRNGIRELVDPSLGESYDQQQMNHVASTAALCIQQSSILRPRMSQVVRLLKGNETGSSSCQGPSLRRTYSEDIFNVEEYSRPRYLKDLNRHKQIALEC